VVDLKKVTEKSNVSRGQGDQEIILWYFKNKEKRMKSKQVVLSLVVLIGFSVVSLPSGVYASEGHQESDNNAITLDFGDETMLSSVWHKIVNTQKELNEAVESGKLETVHKFAFEIRDLSKELLKRTTDKNLSEEQMNNVKAAVEKISKSAAALDEYGDAGDQANTVKELKRFNSFIDFIETQYSESGEQHNQ
jgi:hypothetical protein